VFAPAPARTGLLAPAGMQGVIIDRLSAAILHAVQSGL
jgi:hypothetical protein